MIFHIPYDYVTTTCDIILIPNSKFKDKNKNKNKK